MSPYRGLILVMVIAISFFHPLSNVAQAADPVMLFNGTDFTGWDLFTPDGSHEQNQTWTVQNGVIHCKGQPTGYIRTQNEYENYQLSLEWRWLKDGGGGNSGVLLHVTGPDAVWPKSIEGQLMHENAGDFWVIGGTDFKEHTNKQDRRVAKMKPTNEKPVGEWNTFVAICAGDTIRILINGELQNEATGTSVQKGAIALQSEGTPIQFQKIVLIPLDDKEVEEFTKPRP